MLNILYVQCNIYETNKQGTKQKTPENKQKTSKEPT